MTQPKRVQPGLVTVMMPAYNAASYIAAAIESVLAQSYAAWELLIVNDGSTDATGEIAARYGDPRVRLVHQPNGGESVARNHALELARGEFVAFLDADDLFLPDHLALTVAFLQANPAYDGVYTDGYYIHGDYRKQSNSDKVGQTHDNGKQENATGARLSSQRRGPFRGWLFEELVLASDVFGPPICVVVRSSTIAQQGLRFDPTIVIGPDWDFWTRLAEFATFAYLDGATCLYRVHQTNITVRTGEQKRAASLARCREKAIGLASFARCSDWTRVAAFYDLLINLRRGDYVRQDEISEWPTFAALPQLDQARLLRLMVSKNLAHHAQHGTAEQQRIEQWLARSRALNPRCRRAKLLQVVHRLNPTICQQLCTSLVQAKRLLRPQRATSSPFGELI
jgi:glycosyltransferase involved in cell wall biosynthesis